MSRMALRLAMRSGRVDQIHELEAHLGAMPFAEFQRIIAIEHIETQADRQRDEFLGEFCGTLLRSLAEGFSWICSLLRKEYVPAENFIPKRKKSRGAAVKESKYKGASAAMQTAVFTQIAARARAAAGAEV